MATIEMRGVEKTYAGKTVVRGIDLAIGDGQLAVLLGPSGCGKTTTLRMIAGLEQISGGELYFDDRLMNDEPPERRGIGMVFQTYALYPHMTVAANLAFGLESRREPGKRRATRAAERARVAEIARLLEIDHVLDHRPRELSGGQRQRVALGRALIREPEVFLLDEPLSNLDANLREKMRMELARLHAELPITTVYVTHDQSEALTLADTLIVMNEGTICQAASPTEIYDRPASSFVAGFVGSPGMNLWPRPAGARLEVGSEAGLLLPASLAAVCAGERAPLTLGIRPEHLRLAGDTSVEVAGVRCRVEVVENLGGHLLVHASLEEKGRGRVVAKLAPGPQLRRGEQILLEADVAHVHLFDETGARRERRAHVAAATVGAP
ncbi:MAG: ATP-binding cassette domain-containing protein [Actinomycetota bacterium]|nr:ATP-binding cassette domain-containing protein [Actinomycetota bacterium]